MASINRKFIQSALGSLKLNRRVFHSEDDFQHELAWTIRDSLKGKVQGKLSWVCGDSSLKKKGRRQCSIRLREEYQLEWKPYSEINGQEFRYLLLEV